MILNVVNPIMKNLPNFWYQVSPAMVDLSHWFHHVSGLAQEIPPVALVKHHVLRLSISCANIKLSIHPSSRNRAVAISKGMISKKLGVPC